MTDQHDGTDAISVNRRRPQIRNTNPASFAQIGGWQMAVLRGIAERSPHAINVMLALIEHGTRKRSAMACGIFPSLDAIERRTGLTTSTVQRSLKALREVGLVRWQSGRQGRSNRYEIVSDSLAALDAATDRLVEEAGRLTVPGAAHRLVRKLIELAGFRHAVKAKRARSNRASVAPSEASPSWSSVTSQVVMGDQSGGHARPSQVVMGDHPTRSIEQDPSNKIQQTTPARDRLDAAGGTPRVVVVGSSIEGKPARASQSQPERSEATDPAEGAPDRTDAIRAVLRGQGIIGKPLDEIAARLAGLGIDAEGTTEALRGIHANGRTHNLAGLAVSLLRRMTDAELIEAARDPWMSSDASSTRSAEQTRRGEEIREAARQRFAEAAAAQEQYRDTMRSQRLTLAEANARLAAHRRGGQGEVAPQRQGEAAA